MGAVYVVPTVADVMTRSVHVVGPGTPLEALRRLILENRVGALPVVDGDGRVVGLVCEGDLPQRPFGRVRSPATPPDAASVMRTPAVLAGPELPVADAARLMERAGVRHLPVVDEAGRLVGIAARGDLLKVLLRSDEELRRMIDDVLRRGGWTGGSPVQARVAGGVVFLRGRLPRHEAARLVEQIWLVAGVVEVRDELSRSHGRKTRPEPPRPVTRGAGAAPPPAGGAAGVPA